MAEVVEDESRRQQDPRSPQANSGGAQNLSLSQFGQVSSEIPSDNTATLTETNVDDLTPEDQLRLINVLFERRRSRLDGKNSYPGLSDKNFSKRYLTVSFLQLFNTATQRESLIKLSKA
jgi:hypothetical protein